MSVGYPVVRFRDDDIYGLWKEGDLADDLGWETDHKDAPRIRLVRLHRNGETISLYEPFIRLIVEPHNTKEQP